MNTTEFNALAAEFADVQRRMRQMIEEAYPVGSVVNVGVSFAGVVHGDVSGNGDPTWWRSLILEHGEPRLIDVKRLSKFSGPPPEWTRPHVEALMEREESRGRKQ